MRWKRLLALAGLIFVGPLLMAAAKVNLSGDWRTADRTSTGIAPDPSTTPEAVIQVYSARAFSWRGIFGVHTWIATKPAGAERYTVHQVLGWRVYRRQSAVASSVDTPDRAWYGNAPELIAELRGDAAERAIPEVLTAVGAYPYTDRYTLWPGPNSNTFTAFVTRRVPALRADLPPTAIGKDYLPGGALAGRAPSGTGVQLSLRGLLGVIASIEEGLEINLLGLGFGIDPLGPALRLPGIGRLGWELRGP